MDIGTISLILLLGMFALLAIGMPLGFASAFLAVATLVMKFGPELLFSRFGMGPFAVLGQSIYRQLVNYVLISVPLFIFMAALLERCGIARDMYSSLNVWMSRTRGGIAFVTSIMAVIMAAMSGIIGGEVVLLGLIALPQMLRLGYNQNLAIGTICASGSLGTMIPPSIVLIFYGLVTETSIKALFTASFLPGFMLMGLYVLYVVFLAIFKPGVLGTTVLASLLFTGMQGGYYAIGVWLPTFLKNERHLTVLSSGGYQFMFIVGAFVGYLCGAYLSDRLGRRRAFILFAIGAGLLVYAYTLLPITDGLMLLLGFPLGFFMSGIFSGAGAFLAELFPNELRGSGQGFCYNFGRGIGATFPALVGVLSDRMHLPLGTAIGVCAAVAYAMVVVVAATSVWIGRPIMRATWPAQTLPKLPDGTVKLTCLSSLLVAWK